MLPLAPDNRELRHRVHSSPVMEPGQTSSKLPSILLATTDSEIRRIMSDLLQGYTINTLWAGGMEEIKSALAKEDVAACFCGFWLVDGTYRDVVRHLKRQRAEMPVVIVCAPECPHEYRDYLAALNIRAFDFICHPYRRTDLERILHAAIGLRNQPAVMPPTQSNSSDGAFVSSGLRRAS
jgi:two-component system, OmpR family, response regulator